MSIISIPADIHSGPLRALRHRNYRLFFSGQVISLTGSWMQYTAQAWLIYRITGSAMMMGVAAFADKVPVLLLGLAGGVAADRRDRHRLVMLTQTLLMLQAVAMAVMAAADRVSIAGLLALVIIQGIINAFDLPARQSFVGRMVEPGDLPNALALNSSVFNAARVIGPAAAGVLVAALGEAACFLINAASYLAVLFCLRAMRFDQPEEPRGGGSSARAMLEGLRFAAASPPVRSLLILLGLASIFGVPVILLVPIFAGEILGGGARGLGILMGCMGAGAFVAAVGLARRAGTAGLGRVVASGAVGFGIALVLFALSEHFAISCALLAVAGFCMITQAAATNQLLQMLTPDTLRGRVMSLYTIMFVGMAPFGSLLAGALAERAGAPAAVAAGGLACAVSGLFFAALIPRIRSQARLAEAVR